MCTVTVPIINFLLRVVECLCNVNSFLADVFLTSFIPSGRGTLTAILEERLYSLASALPRLMRQHGQPLTGYV